MVGMDWQRALSRRNLLVTAFLILAGCVVPPAFDREKVCSSSVMDCAPYDLEGRFGRITDPVLAEVSGLAVTRWSDDRLWAINDSGGEPALYLLDGKGVYLGKVEVTGATNVDWEELATFYHEGRPHIVIADIGDNANLRPGETAGKRAFVTLYIVEEPRIEGARPTLNQKVDVSWSQRFVYEDGPRDCESLAVDPDTGKLLLISKRTNPPMLYELPLAPEYADEQLVASRVEYVDGLPIPRDKEKLPNNRYGKYSFQNTAMDISSDGRKAAVLTYGATWLFERDVNESWAEAFAKDPKLVATPFLAQAEALAFTPDGRSLYVTSEGIPAPMLRLRQQQTLPVPD
ncbi:MAG: hypothetical protein HKN59_03410 [Gammaproteobacteria bacterium]|nr:hypothetical protein [Gammaproteobacteria bacterium]